MGFLPVGVTTQHQPILSRADEFCKEIISSAGKRIEEGLNTGG